MSLERCDWCGNNPLYVRYHDEEWGVPVRDDRALFEMLVLDGAQAGLSWLTILRKRDHYRRAFDGFDPELVACYDDRRIAQLLADLGIVRNRLKIAAAVNNAKAYLTLRDRHGALGPFLWRYVGGAPRQNAWKSLAEVPAKTPEAELMSRDLKRLGFSFVGPTICYAFMQAAGMVNDHLTGCFRHRELA
ncbi:MAG: DNA-3-methyladenine glycosylase I [Candidatus Competibacteraceae bacterium]|nr:DNA-3-methyladenine glycosylase I [Candidatus Competibacteraceae bacterium]